MSVIEEVTASIYEGSDPAARQRERIAKLRAVLRDRIGVWEMGDPKDTEEDRKRNALVIKVTNWALVDIDRIFGEEP